MNQARIDARLLVPAAIAWVATACARVALTADPSLAGRAQTAGYLLAGCVAVAPAVSAVVLLRRGIVAVVLLATWAAVTVGALSTLAAAPAPLAGWVDARATAVIDAVVTTEPERHEGTAVWQEPWQQVRLATSTVRARGQEVQVDVPVLLRLPVTASVAPPGSRVTVTGRLDVAWPGSDAAVALRASALVAVSGPGPVDEVAQAMRAGLRAALADRPPEPAALVAGLAVGDESGQPAELAEAMRASGLSHLTAVSGGNISIVLAVVLATAGLTRASLRTRTVASLAALVGFTVLVGPQPSVLRAVAMGVVVTVGVLAGGRRAGPAVLSAAVLVLLLLQPWLATSWGFALSAVATAAIVLIAPLLLARLAAGRRTGCWPPAVQEAVALTVAAQLGTLPVLVAMGGATGWVSLVANLLAAPLVPPVTVLGLAAALVSPLAPGIATVVAHLASWPAAGIVAIAHAGAQAPAPGVPLPSGWTGVIALGVLAAASWAALRVGRRLAARGWRGPPRWALAGSVAAVVVVLVLAPPGRRGWPPADWLLVMCDVGQGDALVLRTGDAAAVVVDTGPEPQAVDRCLTDLGIVEVPAVVLTHFHADHVDGLAGVLRGRAVGQVLVSPVRDPAEGAEDVDRVLTAAGLAARPIRAGDSGQAGAVSWQALWPARRIDAGSVANNASVVLDVQSGGLRFLLTGDIEAQAQQALVAMLAGRRFDVVKTPHHGSANLDEAFVAAAAAPVVLVSVGAGNDYGHPAASAIAAWQRLGSLVVRTDESGDAAVVAVPGAGGGTGVVTRR